MQLATQRRRERDLARLVGREPHHDGLRRIGGEDLTRVTNALCSNCTRGHGLGQVQFAAILRHLAVKRKLDRKIAQAAGSSGCTCRSCRARRAAARRRSCRQCRNRRIAGSDFSPFGLRLSYGSPDQSVSSFRSIRSFFTPPQTMPPSRPLPITDASVQRLAGRRYQSVSGFPGPSTAPVTATPSDSPALPATRTPLANKASKPLSSIVAATCVQPVAVRHWVRESLVADDESQRVAGMSVQQETIATARRDLVHDSPAQTGGGTNPRFDGGALGEIELVPGNDRQAADATIDGRYPAFCVVLRAAPQPAA